jgi:hypothetical protein
MTYRALVETSPPRYAAAASLIVLMPILDNNVSPNVIIGTLAVGCNWDFSRLAG